MESLSVSDENSTFVVDDVKMKYGNMLDQGATTFWETEKGWENLFVNMFTNKFVDKNES